MAVLGIAAPSRRDVQELLIRRLAAASDLDEEHRAMLAQLDYELRDYPAGTSIVEEGDRPRECCLVVEGVTSRYQLSPNGDRQIHAVQITGEIPDLLSLHLGRMDHSLRTLSACRLAFYSHEALWALCKRSPIICAAFWRETLIDAAIHRTSLLRIGQFDAEQRVAHLFCEMKLRFEAVDAVNASGEGRYLLDMTQREIGDLLALSFVSVNRALKELRELGLVRLDRRFVEILDWNGLVEKAGFDPIYLHRSQ